MKVPEWIWPLLAVFIIVLIISELHELWMRHRWYKSQQAVYQLKGRHE